MITPIPKKSPVVHRDLHKSLQEVVNLKGFGRLYQFTNPLDTPVERFYTLARFHSEFNNRFTYDCFTEILDDIIKQLNAGQLNKACYIAEGTKQMIETSHSGEALFKLIACFYITLDEPIADYDYDYNERKIAAIKSHLQESTDLSLSFFLTESTSQLLNQINTSNLDFEALLATEEARRRFTHSLTSLPTTPEQKPSAS
jgi:hypothetical protein